MLLTRPAIIAFLLALAAGSATLSATATEGRGSIDAIGCAWNRSAGPVGRGASVLEGDWWPSCPPIDPRSIQKDDDGWTVNFAFDDGDFPVHVSLATIASWVGATARDEEVRAAIVECASQLGSIARSMRLVGKTKLRL
jgi:hypothetical protein